MRLWVVLGCAPLFFGCANTGIARYKDLQKRAASQDYLAAIHEIQKNRSSLYGSHSDLLYDMDLGVLYHYAGMYDSSLAWLGKAADLHDDLYAHSVTNEAASLLVNDNIRPYRGRPYEIVWLRLFQAFNYLALDRPDDARVEMRQAQIFIDEERRKAGSNAKAYKDDGLYRALAALVYEALGENDDAAISIYDAVKAFRADKKPVPPQLAAYAYRLLNDADRPDDIKELMLSAPASTDAPAKARGRAEIVVVGELGRSPTLGQTSFSGTWVRDGALVYSYQDASGKVVSGALPAPGLPPSEYQKADQGRRTRSGTTLHVKWAMPSLSEVSYQSRGLQVAGPFETRDAEAWGDTRDLLEQDLSANSTTTLTRTVVRVVIRTLAEQEAKRQLNTGNPIVNLLVNLGADALSDQLEQADTRVWFLLPRTVNVARIPVDPGSYTLQLGSEGADGRVLNTETREVRVAAGQKKFVFFTSLK